MSASRYLVLAALAAVACTGGVEPPPPSGAQRSFSGRATVVNFGEQQAGSLVFSLPQPPRVVRFAFRFFSDAGRLEVPEQCSFRAEESEQGLLAGGEDCPFDETSVLPSLGVRSRTVEHFRYRYDILRVELVAANEQHVADGEYALNQDILQGVASEGEGDTTGKPAGTTGFEYRDGVFTTYEPRALDAAADCGRTVLRSESASGVLIEDGDGTVHLQGWGCATKLRGSTSEAVVCDYELEPPADVPRLWLTQIDLGEGVHIMRGELRGADYTYCIDLESRDVTVF